MQPFFFIWDIDPQSFANISLLVRPPAAAPSLSSRDGPRGWFCVRSSLQPQLSIQSNDQTEKRARSPWKEGMEETKSDRGRETKSVSLIKISSVLTHLGLVYRNPDRQYLPQPWEEPGSCSLNKSINWFRSGSFVVTMLHRFEDRCVEELLLASPGWGTS